MLTAPLYMLQVYDRVIPSRSQETLLALTILVAALFAIMGILDYVRARVAARIGATVQARLDAAGLPRQPAPGGAGERALEAGVGAQGPRGGAAAGRLAGALRRLRHALGAGLHLRDLQLPSLLGHLAVAGMLLLVAGDGPQPDPHPAARGGGDGRHAAGRHLRRDDPPAERDGAGARHAGRGARPLAEAARARRSTRSSPRATGSASSRP